ncbi:MAG: DUF5671 domain-containing protein [Microbacteriaceae bacterium]
MNTARLDEAPRATSNGGSALRTVRRLVIYVLLFLLVATAASGVAGLLDRLLESGDVLAEGGTGGVALPLAFTLVAGPLAAILWWIVWKLLADPAERSALAWGLYLTAVSAVSLVTAVSALLQTAAALVSGDWRPSSFSIGLVWAAVWVWHRWMLRHPAKGPTRMVSVPDVIGFSFGLAIGLSGTIATLGALLREAILGGLDGASFGVPWWQSALQALVWAVGGALVWWGHWVAFRGRQLRTVFSDVAVVGIGVTVPSVLALGGVGVTLYVLLRLAFDADRGVPDVLEPLPTALAAALVGALVWLYHRGQLRDRSIGARAAALLATSGVALVGAASGVGVLVNATLASLAPAIAGSDARTLLLGGLSALVVGGAAWWWFWRQTNTHSPGRRIYLVVVFGVSAVVALVTLVVIGFWIFQFQFDEATGSLLERVRAPLGLLIATGLVSAYHFSVWRHDRGELAEAQPVRHPTLRAVTLVAAGDAAATARAIKDATGAQVTLWRRADVDASPPALDPAELVRALDAVSVERVLLITGPQSSVQVIPLD